MIVTVPEIISRLQEEKKTCVLSAQLESEQHLLKFYFNKGTLCRISLGDRRNADCFPLIREGKYRTYSFTEDVGTHIPEACGESHYLLEQIKTIERVVDGGPVSLFSKSVRVQALEPGVIDAVENAFAEFVGPVSAILLDACLGKIGYPKGSRLSRSSLSLILHVLAKELPEQERVAFVAAAGRATERAGHDERAGQK